MRKQKREIKRKQTLIKQPISFTFILKTIKMYWEKYITSQSEILFGKPVIKGICMPVDLFFRYHNYLYLAPTEII